MKSALLSIARRPVVSISASAGITDAIRAMVDHAVSAIVVLEAGAAKGICTERDLVTKLVREGRDPKTSTVSAAMTTPVITVRQDTEPEEALAMMIDRRIRHLPVVDEAGKVVGMLSMRHLMQDRIDRLSQEADALASYAGTEGSAGG